MRSPALRPSGFLFLSFLLWASGIGPAPAAAGEVTSLLLDSGPGEFIGQGEFRFFTPDDGVFTRFVPFPGEPATTNLAHLRFGGEGQSWGLEFAAPPGEALGVGTYESTVAPVRRGPGQPGMQIGGNARGCFDPRGRFEVLQVVFDAAGLPEKFRAVFEQACGAGVLRGEIRFNADVPVVLVAPSRRAITEGRSLAFEVQGFDLAGAPLGLEATGVPPGAAFTDGGAGTGGFAWTPEVGRAGAYWVGFRGRSAAGEADTVYTRIEVLYDFDDFDRAIPFATLPFRSTIAGVIAGVSDDDPECFGTAEGTVWYAFTPASDVRIHVRAADVPVQPPFGAGIAIFTGERGALAREACGRDDAWIEARAGTRYSIMVGTRPGATLSFLVEAVPPPPGNDDFDAAAILPSLPFGETLEVGGATYAGDDPAGCGFLNRTPNVWYAHTPAADTRLTVDLAGSEHFRDITVFTGPRGALVAEACGFEWLGFTATAGRTYHVLLARGLSFEAPSPLPRPTGPSTSSLVLSITGRPPLAIRAAVEEIGALDPRTGAVIVRGTAECSQPARIVVRGQLQQGGVTGEFEAAAVCDGAAGWSAGAAPAPSRHRHGRFAAGPARVVFEAVGVPDDDPNETAGASGVGAVFVRAVPPG